MAHSGRRHLLFGLLATVLVAVAVRVTYYRELVRTQDFGRLMVDAQAYDRAAHGILEGSWPGDRVYYQDPLYPYVLAAQYALIGDSPARTAAVQMTLGVVTVVLVFFLAASVLGTLEAVIAGLLAATYKLFPFYEGFVLKTSLGVLLFSAALLTLVRARRKGYWLSFLSGALLGLASLVRANLLLQIPIALVWLLWPDSDSGWRRRSLRAAGHLLGVLIALAPFTWHNLRCGEFVLTTAQAGQNFYTGNNAGNDTGTYRPPFAVRPHPFFEELDFRRLAEREAGRELRPTEVSLFWFGKAFEWMRENPGDAARLFARKLALVLNHMEVPDNVSFQESAEETAFLRAPLPVFWVVLVLAALGLAVHTWSPATRLLAFALLALALSIALFYVFARYRIPMVPILLLFAAAAPAALVARIREKRWGRVALGLLVASAAGWVASRDLYPVNAAHAHYNRAVNAHHAGDHERALARVDAALLADPNHLLAHLLRADLRLGHGDLEGAAQDLRNAVPQSQGTPYEPQALVLLGRMQVKHGRVEDGLRYFVRALAIESHHVRATLEAASAEKSLGRGERAIERLRDFLRADPGNAEILNALGILEGEAGRFELARDAFQRAITSDPSNVAARLNLGRALEALGETDAARAVYRGILQVEPANAAAKRRLEALGG
ncbi:MAG: tetratricopeptide repeat protein [Planctomycetota bacterium]